MSRRAFKCLSELLCMMGHTALYECREWHAACFCVRTRHLRPGHVQECTIAPWHADTASCIQSLLHTPAVVSLLPGSPAANWLASAQLAPGVRLHWRIQIMLRAHRPAQAVVSMPSGPPAGGWAVQARLTQLMGIDHADMHISCRGNHQHASCLPCRCMGGITRPSTSARLHWRQQPLLRLPHPGPPSPGQLNHSLML